MINDSKIPPIEVTKELREWVLLQARSQDRRMGPWIRNLLTDVMEGNVKIVRVTPIKDIQTGKGA